MFHGYAALAPGEELQPFEFEAGPIGPTDVEIKVEYCGICHSDVSMLDNAWGLTTYPIVPGHEAVGVIAATGEQVHHLDIGQRVGVGWNAGSCMTCEWCVAGDHNLCASARGTIVGRAGGFADRIRADATWTFPIPEALRPEVVGPLLCGGVTVFNPIIQYGIRATDRVGVIGIGGLGHMALKFLDAFGCEVTAFSSNPDKEEEARSLGADHFVNSRDATALNKMGRSLDFILSTVNVPLDWESYLKVLRPKGRLHLVGFVLEPLTVPVGPILMGQNSVSASPDASPATTVQMLEFAAQHNIEPMVESYPLSRVNDAIERLREGKPRYRLVLKI
jgi:uncharacterized zinc-type alcohol dehydrogenase-like protein